MTTKLIESEKGHIYKTPLGELPSVTTILKIYEGGKSGALMGWATKVMAQYLESLADNKGHIIILKDDVKDVFKKAKSWHKTLKQEAADLGSAVHNCIEVYLKGQPIKGLLQENPKIEKPFNAFLEWQKKYNFELLESERIVYSEKFRFAGTLDIVSKIENKLYIIDLKTSKSIYQEYFYQISAYSKAYEEMTNKKIEGLGILRLDKDTGLPEFKEISIDNSNLCFEIFNYLLKIWWLKENANNNI